MSYMVGRAVVGNKEFLMHQHTEYERSKAIVADADKRAEFEEYKAKYEAEKKGE